MSDDETGKTGTGQFITNFVPTRSSEVYAYAFGYLTSAFDQYLRGMISKMEMKVEYNRVNRWVAQETERFISQTYRDNVSKLSDAAIVESLDEMAPSVAAVEGRKRVILNDAGQTSSPSD